MAGEPINITSSYVSIAAAEQEVDGGFSTLSDSLVSEASLTANEQKYPLLDFRLITSADTPTAGDTVELYRIPSDGTNTAPLATSTNKREHIGTFTLVATAAEQYFKYSIANVDPNDKFMWEANGSTVTCELSVRTRSNIAAT